MSVRSHPVIDCGLLGQVFQKGVFLHVFGFDDDAVGEIAGQVWRVWSADEGFSTNGFETVGAEDDVGVEFGFVLELNAWFLEIDLNNRGVQFHGHAQTFCFGNEDFVVVGTVDMQVRHPVPFFGIWYHVLFRKDLTIVVGTQDEVAGSDGYFFNLVQKSPAFEYSRRVWRDLNTSSNLCFSISDTQIFRDASIGYSPLLTQEPAPIL